MVRGLKKTRRLKLFYLLQKTRRLKPLLYKQNPDGARVEENSAVKIILSSSEESAVETASIQTKPGWCAG